jgi:predicted O-methyltransferase YrrM
MNLATFKHDLARGGYVAALAVTASVYRANPVPLPLLRFSRSLAAYDNPLTPRKGIPVLQPRKIDDQNLAQVFAGQTFDEWSLNHDAINFLQRLYGALQPAAVLEFGSGVSTAVFAYLNGDRLGVQVPRLISVEQSPEFASKTRALLARSDLEDMAQFECPGMAEQPFDGETVSCYDLSDAFLARVLATIRPSLIFIDGPFGTGPVRGPILPRLLPHLTAPATVILDDALRDNELRILDAWSLLPGVTVKGVHLIRKGMAEIVVQPRQRRTSPI